MDILNSPTKKQIKLRLKAENFGQGELELKLTAYQELDCTGSSIEINSHIPVKKDASQTISKAGFLGSLELGIGLDNIVSL